MNNISAIYIIYQYCIIYYDTVVNKYYKKAVVQN